MKIVTWAAVAVTALFALMNVGAVLEPGVDAPFRVVGAVLAVVGAGAAVGLGTRRSWGAPAVVVAGALNVAAALAGLFAHEEGAGLGLVVGGLGVLLGALAARGSTRTVAA